MMSYCYLPEILTTPPSYPIYEDDEQRKYDQCNHIDVSLKINWNEDGLLTSDSFTWSDVSCTNGDVECKFMFDEKSEEYAEKARM